jgi:PAS domain S-box-containing protein
MSWQATPYTVPLLAGAVVLVSLAFYLHLRHPQAPAVRVGVALVLVGALWMLADAIQLASTTLLAKTLWTIPATFAIAFIPPGWLALVLQVIGGEKWLNRRNLLLLSIMPVLTLGLALTNDWHHLYWQRVWLDTSGPFITLEKTRGPWSWVFMLYCYTLLLVACFLLFQALRRSRRGYRWQAIFLFVAAFASMTVNALGVSGFSSFPDLATLPVYAIAVLTVSWSLVRTRREDIVAVSHEAILSGMSDAVIVTDARHRVVELNATAERLVGRPAAEVVGLSLRDAFAPWAEEIGPPQHLDEHGRQLALLVGAERRTYDVRVSAVTDWDGQLVSWVLVLRDITAHKEIEATLRQRSAELQARGAELQARSAELQARNEDLDAFARTVAHDLKGPLVGIIGYAETARRFSRAMPVEHIEECLDAIIDGGRKLDRIIEELLLLASVRAEQVQIEPLPMARVVADVLQRLNFMVQEYGAEVVLPGTWPDALGCEAWVREVWSNYISNAIKYGGRPPRVTLGASKEAGGVVRFWVRDNGAGLIPEEQAQLFRPFTQLARVRAEGHGLGLSIVRYIVEKLGGRAWVESEVGKGSVFCFTLPAARRSGSD